MEPTPHRIDLTTGRRWTWCAPDAVGIVGAIGEGLIRSETTDGTIELHIRDGALEPTGLAVFLADANGMTSSIDQWCPLINFHPSLDAAVAWAAKAGVQGTPVEVAEIAR